jgi:hypothetical protein
LSDPPELVVLPVVAVEDAEQRVSGGGAEPSMKWKYTNGPPTTATATAAAPISNQRLR